MFLACGLGGGAALATWASSQLQPTYAAKHMTHVPADLNLTLRHQQFPVVDVQEVSHDTKIVSFGLGQGQAFHLDAAQTLQCSIFDYAMGKRITRHYTPITPNGTAGHFDVMIKRYEGGYMSPKVHNLSVGDSMEWAKVPPAFLYKRGLYDNMYMIAGGVGITPMLQLIRTVLADPEDKTKMKLLFMNKTPRDILLKGELDEIAKTHPERFTVSYAIDKTQEGWTGEVGHVNERMVRKTLKDGPPTKGEHMLVCGSDGFMSHVAGAAPAVMMYWSGKNKTQPTFQGVNNLGPVQGVLGNLGWTTENCWRF